MRKRFCFWICGGSPPLHLNCASVVRPLPACVGSGHGHDHVIGATIDRRLPDIAGSVVIFERRAGASGSIADDRDQGWARDGRMCWVSHRALSRSAMSARRSRCGAAGCGRPCRPQALLPGTAPAGLGNPIDFSVWATPLSAGVWSRQSARCGSHPIAR